MAIKVVGTELKRVSRHPGKHISSAVWNEGVMQRLSTKDLYMNLTNEYKGLKVISLDLEERIKVGKEKHFHLRQRHCVLHCQLLHVTKMKETIELAFATLSRLNLSEGCERQWRLEKVSPSFS